MKLKLNLTKIIIRLSDDPRQKKVARLWTLPKCLDAHHLFFFTQKGKSFLSSFDLSHHPLIEKYINWSWFLLAKYPSSRRIKVPQTVWAISKHELLLPLGASLKGKFSQISLLQNSVYFYSTNLLYIMHFCGFLTNFVKNLAWRCCFGPK